MVTKIPHIKLQVTVPEKPPQKMIEDFIKGAMKSPDKAYKRLEEVITDYNSLFNRRL